MATASTALKTILLELPVALSEREEVETARAKAKLEQQLAAQRDKFGAVKREWTEEFKEIEIRIQVLGDNLLTGRQLRPVEVVEQYVKEGEHAGKVEQIRTDTGEVVDRRMADLFEARSSDPKYKSKPRAKGDAADAPANDDTGEVPKDLLAEAEKAQRDAGVEEDDEGNVVVPETSVPKAKRGGGKPKSKSKR